MPKPASVVVQGNHLKGKLKEMDQRSEPWEALLFGLPRVRCEDQSTDHFQTRQATLLFAYLTVYSRRHPRSELADLLWPDAEPESGRRRLSQALWHIRQTLESLCPEIEPDILIADRNAVGINVERITSDIARFRHLLRRDASRNEIAQAESIEQAALLYGNSGGFLTGFYDDWVLLEREKLQTEYLTALTTLTGHYERTGDWQRSVEWAERAVVAEPLREDLHAHLIRLLVAHGQTAAARRQYETLADLLARELDTEPTATTRALIKDGSSAPRVSPMSPPEETAPTSPPGIAGARSEIAPLPVLLTSFYGREAFLGNLRRLLEEPKTRVITLLGTGGIGKTRLALELAHMLAAQSQEPMVAFVPLADIVEPRLIMEAIADALTPRSATPPLQRITDALTTIADALPFLLILDNAEHIATAVGETAKSLLGHIPRLKILVTSQRNLGISGERVLGLTPLELSGELPQAGTAAPGFVGGGSVAPSVQLFIDRARSVRPDFPSDATSLADVARICERLEGLPLAIELCAGWAQTLGTRQMLEMLTRRFELLVSRRSDIPARHRTLRAAIEYSYMQLSLEMQEFFVSLSVFRDGWTLAAAAAVCADGSLTTALTMLAQMRERSLIMADEVRASGVMRYKMLEGLREFALEQRTMAQVREHDAKHAAYFVQFVAETIAHMEGPDGALWAVRFDDEIANLRAALEYRIFRLGKNHPDEDAIEATWGFTAAVAKTWNGRGHARETIEWVTRALAMEALVPGETAVIERDQRLQRLRARLYMIRAESFRIVSDFGAAAASAEQALGIWRELGDVAATAECLELLGIITLFNDDYDHAQKVLTEALDLARRLGEPFRIAQILSGLSGVAVARQDWQTAHALMTECLELGRRLDNNRTICSYLNNLSLIARYQGHYAEARELLHEAIALRDRHGLIAYSAFDLNLAVVERLDGCYAEALLRLSAATRNTRVYGERRVLAWCIKETGHLAVTLKQYQLGVRCLSCAEALRSAIGMSFKPFGPQDIAQDREICVQILGASEVAAIWVAGASTDPDTVITEALSQLADFLQTG